MSVKAKFKVTRFESQMHGRRNPDTGQSEDVEMRTVVLAPVYGTDPASENKKYWDFTPSGEIKLGTVNPAAWAYFGLGEEHYVTFERAEKAEGVSS